MTTTVDIDVEKIWQWLQTPIRGTLTPLEFACLYYPLQLLDGLRIAWQRGAPPPKSLKLVRIDAWINVAASLTSLYLMIRARKQREAGMMAGLQPPAAHLLPPAPARFARAA